MGVLVGDDPVYSFPPFVVALTDECLIKLRRIFNVNESRVRLPGMCPARSDVFGTRHCIRNFSCRFNFGDFINCFSIKKKSRYLP